MLATPAKQDEISFSSVAFKGVFRIIFIILIALIVSMVCVASYFSSNSPKNYNGESENGNIVFVVTGTAEQPVRFTVSHVYPIKIYSFGFEITDGPDLISFNLTVLDKNGEVVHHKDSSLVMPNTIETYKSDTAYSVSEESFSELAPGTYHLILTSTHPLKYAVIQDYRYQPVMNVASALAVLGILVLIAVTIAAFRRRDALRKERSIAIFSSHVYGVPMTAGPANPYSYASSPSYGPQAGYYNTGQEAVDYQCGKCGNIIQNPVVQNVITCEKCGEKEYVPK